MTFAEYIKELRLELGCSQEHLALRTGLTRQTINRLERGAARPKLQTQRILAQALGVSVLEFRKRLRAQQERVAS